jgi:hypothetical protein
MKYIRVLSAVRLKVRMNRFSSGRDGLLEKKETVENEEVV